MIVLGTVGNLFFIAPNMDIYAINLKTKQMQNESLTVFLDQVLEDLIDNKSVPVEVLSKLNSLCFRLKLNRGIIDLKKEAGDFAKALSEAIALPLSDYEPSPLIEGVTVRRVSPVVTDREEPASKPVGFLREEVDQKTGETWRVPSMYPDFLVSDEGRVKKKTGIFLKEGRAWTSLTNKHGQANCVHIPTLIYETFHQVVVPFTHRVSVKGESMKLGNLKMVPYKNRSLHNTYPS